MGVFSSLKPKERAERNGFDRSSRHVFSAKVGQIKPCFVLPTLPSSEYEIDVNQLLRTQPLQTAAFTGFSVNYDFAFVPYNQLYSSFNQFIAQRQNKQIVNQPTIQTLPTFNLQAFVYFVVRYAAYDYLVSQTTFDEFQNDFQKWCCNGQSYSPAQGFSYADVVPYNLITTSQTPTQSVLLNVIASLDMYGYGNYLPFVKLLASYMQDKVTDIGMSGSGDFTEITSAFAEIWKGNQLESQTYLDFFEFIGFLVNYAEQRFYQEYDLELIDVLGSRTNSVQPTLWPALAYNKIFHEYYRNEYYDSNMVFNRYGGTDYVVFHFSQTNTDYIPYVYLFNYDDFNGVVSSFQWLNDLTARTLAIFNLYPHQYKKDLVTAVLPSTQFGDVSTMVTDDNFRSLISRTTSPLNTNAREGVITNFDAINSQSEFRVGIVRSSGSGNALTQFKFDPSLAISILEQRRADSLQRFRERMLRAGDKTKDIFRAHGWSEPISENKYEPAFLGSFDGQLNINTVAATSASADVELAQLGANGVASVNGSKIRFKCSDFGVVIGVVYIVKSAEYDAYQLERSWQLTEPFDFPYPEIQNISLQPVTSSQVMDLDYSDQSASPATSVIGFAPSFIEYKTALDRVHGEFYSAIPMQPRIMGTHGNYGSFRFMNVGAFSSWVTPRRDIKDVGSLSYLYQQIDCADNVFKLAGTSCPDTDPFLINCYFDVKAVQPLSVIGLPI